MSLSALAALGGVAKAELRAGQPSRAAEGWLVLLIATAWEHSMREEAGALGLDVHGFGLSCRPVGWQPPSAEVMDAFTDAALRGLRLSQ